MPTSEPAWYRVLEAEHPDVVAVYQEAIALSEENVRFARADQPPDLARCRAVAQRLVEGMRAAPMHFMQLALRPTSEEPFLIVHPVNVAIILMEMAQGWSGLHLSLEEVALLGLVHDVGLAKVQEIVMQPRQLTAEERVVMQRHVEMTHQLLSRVTDLSPDILSAVTEDHERLDGSGYPQQRRRADIHRLGALLAVADIFEAMTHGRPYRPGRAPYLVLRELLSAGANVLDPAFLKLLVCRLGIYPVGSWVELSSREIARVVKTRPETPLRPLVEVMGAVDHRMEGRRRLLDLSVVAGVSITRWVDEATVQRYASGDEPENARTSTTEDGGSDMTSTADPERGSTILVVDDEPSICQLLKDFLSSEGYDVLVAHEANSALHSVQAHRPSLVLLDIRLPGMDGSECLRRIKTIDPRIGVIMVTAVEDEGIGRKCLELGAFEYITKPISLERLKTCLLLTQLFRKK